MTSKSALSRKRCAEMLLLITQHWEGSLLERQSCLMEEVLSKGLQDSDTSARKTMRRCVWWCPTPLARVVDYYFMFWPRVFWGYHAHFPTSANKLFDSLDPQQQRHINDGRVFEEGAGQVTAHRPR